jgi:hypothetical protein
MHLHLYGLGKSPPVPTEEEAGWAPEPVCTTCRRESSWLYRDSNSDPPVVQPVTSHYTDYAIPASLICGRERKFYSINSHFRFLVSLGNVMLLPYSSFVICANPMSFYSGALSSNNRSCVLTCVFYSSVKLDLLWLLWPSVGLWLIFSFLILYTVGRTSWTRYRLVARSLPTQRTT